MATVHEELKRFLEQKDKAIDRQPAFREALRNYQRDIARYRRQRGESDQRARNSQGEGPCRTRYLRTG